MEHMHVGPLAPRVGLQHDPPVRQTADSSDHCAHLLWPKQPWVPHKMWQDRVCLPSTTSPRNTHWFLPQLHKKIWNWCLFSKWQVSHLWSVAFFTAQYNPSRARGIFLFKRKQLLMNTKGVTDFALPHPLPIFLLSETAICSACPEAQPLG